MKRNYRLILCIVLVCTALLCVLTACDDSNQQGEDTKYVLTFNVDGAEYHAITTAGNETIELPTNPNKTGYDFGGWYFDNTEWSERLYADTYNSKTLTSDKNVYAKWNARSFTITVEQCSEVGGTVLGGGTYEYGTQATLTAVVNEGYKFEGWYRYGHKVSDELNYTFTVGASDEDYFAKWSRKLYTISEYGKYIWFGEYPQTIKADGVTVGSIADEDGYYIGSDGYRYAKIVAMPSEAFARFSNYEKITAGTTYFFKVEPIKWRILSRYWDGTAMLFCDSIIANHCFYNNQGIRTIDGKSVYANNYAYSDIRAWLNNDFYNSAFDDDQREMIVPTAVENGAFTTANSQDRFVCENTEDNIYLFSYKDIVNPAYGFNADSAVQDTKRQLVASDYSLATGVNKAYFDTEKSWWWLRSPGFEAGSLLNAIEHCGDWVGAITATLPQGGVAPALTIRI